jgi:hypothetical protein
MQPSNREVQEMRRNPQTQQETLEITLSSTASVDCTYKRNLQEKFTGADIRLLAVRNSLTDVCQ